MNSLRFISLFFLFGGAFVLPVKLLSINKYTVFVQQPNIVKAPVIKWVTVTDNKKNNIAWEKQVNDNIVYYNVYRSSGNTESSWDLAGTVDYNSETYLNDLNSYANIQSYRYRIAAVDKCGYETFSNAIFRTIYLQIKKVNNESNTLEWNPYVGMNVTVYRVYKGLTPDSLALIDSTAAIAMVTTYTDSLNPHNNVYYRVEADGFETDSVPQKVIRQSFVKAGSNNVKSVSNIVFSSYDSILNPFENESLHIYPNPMKAECVVQFPYDPAQHYQLVLLDLLGNKVFQQPVLSSEFLINRGNLNEGLYILQIVGKMSIQKKLIVGGTN
jgi:hypothetical protein